MTVPPVAASTEVEADLASATLAWLLTVGSDQVEPPMSVCFTCVPLAMYWTGWTAAPLAAGPMARKRYWAL